MIQLATDPNASRLNWRPAATDPKESSLSRKGRSGHAWPFISQYAERPAAPQEPKRPTTPASGS